MRLPVAVVSFAFAIAAVKSTDQPVLRYVPKRDKLKCSFRGVVPLLVNGVAWLNLPDL